LLRNEIQKIDHKAFSIDWTYKSWNLNLTKKLCSDMNPLINAQKNGLIPEHGKFTKLSQCKHKFQDIIDDISDENDSTASETDNEINWAEIENKEEKMTAPSPHSLHTVNQTFKYAALLIAGDGHLIIDGKLVPLGEGHDYTKPIMRSVVEENMQKCSPKKDKFHIRIDGVKTSVLTEVMEEMSLDYHDEKAGTNNMPHIPTGTDYDLRKWVTGKRCKV